MIDLNFEFFFLLQNPFTVKIFRKQSNHLYIYSITLLIETINVIRI